jgi:hypothetical protein
LNILAASAKTDEFPGFYSRSLIPVLVEAAKRGHICSVATTDEYFPPGPYCIKVVKFQFTVEPGQQPDSEFKTELQRLEKRFGTDPAYRGWLRHVAVDYRALESWEQLLLKIVTATQPDVIVNIADQDLLAKCSAHAAYRRKIPSVTWLPAIAGTHPTLDIPVSDFAVVGGEGPAEYYLKRGYPDKQLLRLGYPWLDRFTPTSHGSAVLFGTENCNTPEALGAFKQVLEACKRSGRELILSVHPREDPVPWFKAAEGQNVRVITGPRENVDLLQESSHVVVNQSGLGLEALLSGCRLVIYPNRRQLWIDFVGEGAAIPLHDGFLDREEPRGVQDFIKRWNISADGQASKRLVDFLETLEAKK